MGGELAIGHPMGSSGVRITRHPCTNPRRKDARYCVATMCCGGGRGVSTAIERES